MLTLAIMMGGIRCKSGLIGKSVTKSTDDGIGNTMMNEKIDSIIIRRIINIMRSSHIDRTIRTWKRLNTIKGNKIGLDLLKELFIWDVILIFILQFTKREKV